MINYNPKLTDQDMIDALVNYVRKGGAVRKIVTPRTQRVTKPPKDTRIVMSRVAAAPVTPKVTQGYAIKTLRDVGYVR